MKRTNLILAFGMALIIVGMMNCQQKAKGPAELSQADSTAVNQILDSMINDFKNGNADLASSYMTENAVNMEYDKIYRGAEEIRSDHFKKESELYSFTIYNVDSRVIRGRNGIAYTHERNIIEMKDKAGKTFFADSCWASSVLEKQVEGTWKIVQHHFSGPNNWVEK